MTAAGRTLAAPVQRVKAAGIGQAAISPLPAWRGVPVSRMRVPARRSGVRGKGPVLMAGTGRQGQNAAHVGATRPGTHTEEQQDVKDSLEITSD